MAPPQTLVSIVALLALASTSARPCDAAADPLKKVIDEIEANYAAISSARGEIEQTVERSQEVERRLQETLVRQTIDDLLPDGDPRPGDRLRVDPAALRRDPFVSSFVLLRNDIRVNGFADHPEIVSVAKGDKFANYQPMNNAVQVWARSTHTGMFRDPRTVFDDESQRLTETLSGVKSVHAKSVKVDEMDLLRLTLVARNGNQVAMDCDPSASYLPVFVAEVMPDGTNTTCEVECQKWEANGQDVWFPATLVFKIWRKETPVTQATEAGWNQKTTYTIRNLQINVEVSPDDVSVEVPAGTSVRDSVDNSFYTTTRPTSLP